MRYLLPALASLLVLSGANPASAIVGGKARANADEAEAMLLSGIVKISIRAVRTQLRTCTGTLIDRDLVLTAAHCLATDKAWPSQIAVSLAYKDRKTWRTSSRAVQAYSIHPDYEPKEWTKNDIALIKLARPFSASELPAPTQLPPKSTDFDDFYNYGPFLAAGFGLTSDLGGRFALTQLSSTLKYTGFVQTTRENFKTPILVNEFHDFGRYMRTTKESGSLCYGDSGGPLLTFVGDKPTVFALLAGVVSTYETPEMAAEYRLTGGDQKKMLALNLKYPKHHPCIGAQGAFTDVSLNRDWIDRTIAKYEPVRTSPNGPASVSLDSWSAPAQP